MDTPERMCSFPGCGNVHRTYGLCMAHDLQRQAGLRLRPLRNRTPKHKGCKVADCNRLHHALGYCQAHYTRYRRGTLPINQE
jgi:hypothetical protein